MAFNETKFSVTRWNADAAPLVEGTRCISVIVPDDDFFVRVLAAAYSLACPKTNWEGDEAARQDVSSLVEAAFELTDWDGCMDCAGVAECIATDEGTQEALDGAVATFISTGGSGIYNGLAGMFPGIGAYTFPAGVPQSPSQVAVDQAQASVTNPTCDNDILWSQCLALVQSTNRIIVDVFERIEAATNSVELADAATEFPIIGWVKEALGGDFVLDLIQYWQNSIAEGYNAQYTSDVENEIACGLFCVGQANGCELTLENCYDYFTSRLMAHADIPPLSSFIDFLEFVTGLTVDGTLVVDLAFYTSWLGIKWGSFFFSEPFGDRFKLITALAVNDANDDWILLCDTCPQTYCDSMAEGLGPDTQQPDVTHVFDAYCVASPGEWQTPGGVDDDGYISSQGVSCVFGGDDFYQAEAYYDFGVDVTVTAASMMITNGPAATDAPCQIRLFDSSKTLIGYDDHGGGVGGWRLYEMGTITGTASGVRYICWCSVAVGDEAGLDDICVTWTPD
jgi:hypothetical protein